MSLKLHNTLTGQTEEFQPINSPEVRMYHCGPTVYGRQHIGNLSMFVFTDVLRRTLELEGYAPKQVINFTDFGHLTSDADEGEDKMARGLKAEGLEPSLGNMKKLGEKYAEIFMQDLKLLNINTDGTQFPYASEYIDQQIDLIKTLEEKGFTYQTSDGIYFDTSKFPDYGKLGNIRMDSAESRIGANSEKKNPQDFALWKFNTELGWQSPWGQGFPGWHIECSAMIISLLGEQIDIHTGGIEHIAVHHNNEIAQSEAATGKSPFSRFWLHREHLRINAEKIAKSLGNTIYLDEITEKGFSPLAFRYLLLQSHYRTKSDFSWEALEAAQTAYRKLKDFYSALPGTGKVNDGYVDELKSSLENDLNTSEALAIVWKLVKDESISSEDKKATLKEFDKALGLDLENNEFEVSDVPEEVYKLLADRDAARIAQNWVKADLVRDEIRKLGFEVLDTESGQKLKKI